MNAIQKILIKFIFLKLLTNKTKSDFMSSEIINEHPFGLSQSELTQQSKSKYPGSKVEQVINTILTKQIEQANFAFRTLRWDIDDAYIDTVYIYFKEQNYDVEIYRAMEGLNKVQQLRFKW